MAKEKIDINKFIKRLKSLESVTSNDHVIRKSILCELLSQREIDFLSRIIDRDKVVTQVKLKTTAAYASENAATLDEYKFLKISLGLEE